MDVSKKSELHPTFFTSYGCGRVDAADQANANPEPNTNPNPNLDVSNYSQENLDVSKFYQVSRSVSSKFLVFLSHYSI